MTKKILTILLCVLMLMNLGACTSQPEPTEAPPQVSTEAPTETPTEAPAEIPAEPSILRNPFSGEVVEETSELRPYAVSMNNVKAAMPQHGIGQAEIVYEMLVEGGLTRCLAIFSDVSDVAKIGSIRSARIYTTSLMQSCDAILVRCGGSEQAINTIAALGWDEIDGYKQDFPFYRDQARLDDGYAWEHTLFTSGPDLIADATGRGLRLTHEGGINYGLNFAEDAIPDGDTAHTISLSFSKVKSSAMYYDAESGKYLASQYKTDWIDGATGETLAFENVLILRSETWTQENGIHVDMTLVGEGTGYYANGGYLIPIRWSRSADDQPFIYTQENGRPLCVGIGASYIGIIPTGANVTWE